jgi:hypothetical protein
MIDLLRTGLARFLADPLGALGEMRAATPSAPVAAAALLAATLVWTILDFLYAPMAFPHSFQPGGKREHGAAAFAAIAVARVYAFAAIVWMGARFLLRQPTTPAAAIWMTVPYALALIVAELLEMSAFVLALTVGVNVYMPFFFIGWCGALLVLIASVRALCPRSDWLAALPVGFAAVTVGHYFAPLVLLVALFLLPWRHSDA